MKHYGLIGFPLSHSFSKKYFAEKFKSENITDAVYNNYPLENIDELQDLLDNNPGLCGLNVTVPHKKMYCAIWIGLNTMPARQAQ